MRLTYNTVEVLSRNKRVASHVRSYRQGSFTTLKEHMPKSHQNILTDSPFRPIRLKESQNLLLTPISGENFITTKLVLDSDRGRRYIMLNNQTIEKLYDMKINGMAEAFKEQLGQPSIDELSFEERFALLVNPPVYLERRSPHEAPAQKRKA